jgi:hypothetical protein
LITDESYPTWTCGCYSWRRLETQPAWPDALVVEGTGLRELIDPKNTPVRAEEVFSLPISHAAPGHRKAEERLGLLNGLRGMQAGRQRPCSVMALLCPAANMSYMNKRNINQSPQCVWPWREPLPRTYSQPRFDFFFQ